MTRKRIHVDIWNTIWGGFILPADIPNAFVWDRFNRVPEIDVTHAMSGFVFQYLDDTIRTRLDCERKDRDFVLPSFKKWLMALLRQDGILCPFKKEKKSGTVISYYLERAPIAVPMVSIRKVNAKIARMAMARERGGEVG